MNTTRKMVVSLMAVSFLGATALPTMAQQNATPSAPKMEKRMAHTGPSKRGGKRHGMRGMQRAFERYDTNKDGVITQEEVDAAVVERFNDIAGDDGTITLEQYRVAWMERSLQPRVRAFQRLDRDGDGNITQAEFDQASERMFSRLDRDGNGELTRPTPDQSAGNRQDRGKHGKRGGHGRGGGRVIELMERFDVDKDGKITRAEFDEVRAQAFGGADADGNSAITLEEFATIWQDLNGQRMTRGFQRLDSDGSLTVTQEEYAARSQNFVEKHDRNGDGVVTKADRRGGKQKGKKHRSMKQEGKKGEPRKAGSQAAPDTATRKVDI